MERFANEPDIVVLIGSMEKGKRVSKMVILFLFVIKRRKK